MKQEPAVLPSRRAVRQTLVITVIAVVAYVGIRNLPVDSGALHYDDFGAGQGGPLEFCEPGGPQFVPVDRVRSPVVMTLRTEAAGALRAGAAARLTVALTSASGKPVTEADLLVVHTQKLHLLVIDPALEDYQHLHPVATTVAGEYAVEFTPRRAGEYRVFADFTPRPTGRALYAGARLEVAATGDAGATAVSRPTDETREVVVDGFRFALALDREPPRINELAELRLSVLRPDGAPAALDEIMGARAHVVAFDLGRTGFAHLHPMPAAGGESAGAPLRFQLSLADPGTYRLWAQVKIDGRERFAPFTLSVRP